MDWVSALVLWTPVSVALLGLWLAALFASAVLIFVHRTAVGVWFLARWNESSTANARILALTTTSGWLLDLAGMLPAGEHISFRLVELGWLAAAALFIKPDAKQNPFPAGP